jgi:signal transduction histidine kinase
VRQSALTCFCQKLYAALSEADQRRSQFFANVSHEFRTPLTLITAPAERVLSQPNLEPGLRKNIEVWRWPAPCLTFAQMIYLNARTLLRQVNDLLDLSKLDAGKLQVHYHRFDLRRLLQYTADHFGSLSESKSIDLTLDIEHDLPMVELDSEKV